MANNLSFGSTSAVFTPRLKFFLFQFIDSYSANSSPAEPHKLDVTMSGIINSVILI